MTYSLPPTPPRLQEARAWYQISAMPPFMLPAAMVAFLLFGIGPNSLTAAFALAVLVIGSILLWRPGEPPILLYVFGFQWLQAAIGIFYANVNGLGLEEVSRYTRSFGLATTLSLIGLLFLACGIRMGAGRPSPRVTLQARQMIFRQTNLTWFKLYVVTWIAALVALALARAIPGLSQPLLALANLKWAAFLIFTIAAFSRPSSGFGLWIAAFVFEFMLSLGGYFSSFKLVFLFTLIGLGAAGVKISPARACFGVAVSAALVFLGVAWTAIKPEYRMFVSGGRQTQAVLVDFGSSVGKLLELVGGLSFERMGDAAGRMIERISYVEFFGAALDRVPTYIPHQFGTLWFDAISRPLMPRILFPNKPVIDESVLTNQYTGIGVAGADRGTQISMGYMAESYIDFGVVGMMVAIFLFGLFLGLIYRYITMHPHARGLLGMGIASAILMTAAQLEGSTTKLFGGLIVSLLVAWLLVQFVVPILFSKVSGTPSRTVFAIGPGRDTRRNVRELG